jgi:hypothetical protein
LLLLAFSLDFSLLADLLIDYLFTLYRYFFFRILVDFLLLHLSFRGLFLERRLFLLLQVVGWISLLVDGVLGVHVWLIVVFVLLLFEAHLLRV